MGLDELTGQIIHAAYEVHNTLGPGRTEAIYANALAVELKRRGLRVDKEAAVKVAYAGEEVGRGRVDLVVQDRVAVEVKASGSITEAHLNQLRAYLRSSGLGVGLLVNFGTGGVEVKRLRARSSLEHIRAHWSKVLALVECDGHRRALAKSKPWGYDGECLIVSVPRLPKKLDVNLLEEALLDALERFFGGTWDVWLRMER